MVVLNNTKVIPARVFSENGRIELLLIERIAPSHWRCLVRPGRKMRLGTKISVAGTTAEVEQVLGDGSRLMAFAVEPDLEKFGAMPLPPYISRAVEPEDRVRYQTVYATESGAVAAPTAGLHFTGDILSKIITHVHHAPRRTRNIPAGEDRTHRRA